MGRLIAYLTASLRHIPGFKNSRPPVVEIGFVTLDHGSRKANIPRIDDLSDAEFMKLQAEYGDSLPICPICTLEDAQHLLLELVADDAVSDEVKSALAPVLYAVTGALVTDRAMAEQGGGSAHLGGDEDMDDDGVAPKTQ